jgi:ribonuclease HII
MHSPPPLKSLELEASRKGTAQEALDFLKSQLSNDSRPAAKKLVLKFEKRLQQELKERERLVVLLKFEKALALKGCKLIAGLDEAGRGPLVGPVVAAAVILPPGLLMNGVNDSKKLTHAKREELDKVIREKALGFGLGQASAKEIDQINIYQAARLAMERAIQALPVAPDGLLTDAMPLPSFKHLPQQAMNHGDSLSMSIASASILAKVARDKMMVEMDAQYPGYGFAAHKGYGTEQHLAAIKEKGLCPEHRLSFAPVAQTLAAKDPRGTFGFWKGKLEETSTLVALKQAGLSLKRLAGETLTESDLAGLREVYSQRATKLKAAFKNPG